MSIVNLPPKIFACSNSMVLGKNIATAYGIELGNVITSTYSDGEFQPSYEESIRGTRIFVIASTNPGPENLMELLLMLDAAKRASARHITAVIPYFGWARQDRKDKPRVPIAAKLVAKMLETAEEIGCTTVDGLGMLLHQAVPAFERWFDRRPVVDRATRAAALR
jgi:ribose-phosphate pyrophosphokinase